MNWNEVFRYDNGYLYWKIKPANQININDKAGCLDKKGYVIVRFKGKSYKAHRLIYAMHFGEVSEGVYIDHINMIKNDNRINNLRVVSPQENRLNTNAKGYYFCSKTNKYRSQIYLNGLKETIGFFESKEDAHIAYLKRKAEIHSTWSYQ